MAETPQEHYERWLGIVRESILSNYPNPERKGCPGATIVREVAERTGPLVTDAPWEHITHCSPCYAEFLEYKEAARRRRQHLRRNLLLCGSLLTVLLLVAIGGYLYSRTQFDALATAELYREKVAAPQPPAGALRWPVVRVRADFSDWSTFRSVNPDAVTKPPLLLPRGYLSLEIHLSQFSSAGDYRVILRQGAARVVVDQIVRARVSRGRTILGSVDVDTNSATPGLYELAIQRRGTLVAQTFPIRILAP